MRISDWSSDVCSSDLLTGAPGITVLASDERLDVVTLEDVPAMMQAFRAFGPLFDYCVIDTPPTWGALNFAALSVSDHLVAPIEMKDYALDGVEQLLKTIHAAEQRSEEHTSELQSLMRISYAV